jgi:predicted glycoside hydrolase/deacetylase ChbG (UPF0249 family)
VTHESRAPRLLIVNADDFGLTSGVCRAILRAHRHGIVTSTSALALGPAFRSCAPMLDDAPDLGIGIHLAAVGEDPPLLSAAEIPTLVDRQGKLAYSWRQFLPRLAARRVDPDDVRREFAAQGEHVRATVGAERITHVDTHQHLHLWPRVATIVCDLAREWNVPALRVTRSTGKAARGRGMNVLAQRLRRRAAAAGLRTPEAFAGFDEAGAFASDQLVRAVEELGAGRARSAEIGVHPGEHEDDERHRYEWGYQWGAELDALVDPAVRAAVNRNGFVLGSFAQLENVAR